MQMIDVTQSPKGIVVATVLIKKLIAVEQIETFGTEVIALAENSATLLLNCERLEFFSSAALNQLIIADKRQRQRQSYLGIAGLRHEIQGAFDESSLDKLFECFSQKLSVVLPALEAATPVNDLPWPFNVSHPSSDICVVTLPSGVAFTRTIVRSIEAMHAGTMEAIDHLIIDTTNTAIISSCVSYELHELQDKMRKKCATRLAVVGIRPENWKDFRVHYTEGTFPSNGMPVNAYLESLAATV